MFSSSVARDGPSVLLSSLGMISGDEDYLELTSTSSYPPPNPLLCRLPPGILDDFKCPEKISRGLLLALAGKRPTTRRP